jgi:hypothetical protein
MSSPFTPVHRVLMLVTAAIAVLIAGGCLVRAFHPRWRRGELRYGGIGLAVLLLLCAAVLVMVACATSFVIRHPLSLPTLALVGLTISFLANQHDERRKAQTSPGATNERQKVAHASTEPWKSKDYLVSAAALVGLTLLMVQLREIYLCLAIGVGFFLVFVVPPESRRTVAGLFGFLALWAIPALWNGIRWSQFLILSALYGVESVWSGAIRVTRGRPFIQLSNGDEFHGAPLFLWHLATFLILAIIGVLWLLLLIWLSKRLYPPFYVTANEAWRAFRKQHDAHGPSRHT